MGQKQSKAKKTSRKITKSDLEELAKVTYFNYSEIEFLYNHFKALSNSSTSDNMINIHEFQEALKLPSTEFTQRIFSAFDSDGSMQIEFDEFVCGLSAMSTKASLEDKAEFCFKVYDIDKNGSIDKSELKQILTFSLGGNTAINLSAAQINTIVDTTFKQMDKNNDGGISLQEFIETARQNPTILNCVNLKMDDIFK